MKFKEINIPHLQFILAMKYSKFLYEFPYKSLTMVSKKITDKFRVKMQNLSNTKTFETTTNLCITEKSKKKFILKSQYGVLQDRTN